jgi:hypothetical protein
LPCEAGDFDDIAAGVVDRQVAGWIGLTTVVVPVPLPVLLMVLPLVTPVTLTAPVLSLSTVRFVLLAWQR